jgi:hypothetical protein
MYSWYLDAVSDSWGGLVNEDYSTIFPVTYTQNLGVKQFYQAFFTREFEVLGDGFNLREAINYLQDDFKMVNFRTSINSLNNIESIKRKYQFIDLNSDFETSFSTNAKRLIKKSDKQFNYRVFTDVTELMELVRAHVAFKIKEFTPENITKLNGLMISALKNNKGELIGVYNDLNNLVAAGFFFQNKNNITYLKGASTDEAKKKGAMFGLMNFAFNRYRKNFSKFDFGGSNVDNVAQFYKKFGAKDMFYFDYTINHLPLWFKGLKKLKR